MQNAILPGATDTLGTPVPFSWDGYTWEIPRWDIGTENAFAAWVYAQAMEDIRQQRRDLGEEEYREEMASLRRDKSAGLYEWGSKIVTARWQSDSGSKHLLYLTLRGLDSKVTPDLIRRLAEDRDSWEYLWKEILIPLNFPQRPALEKAPEAGKTA